jgi:prepilin-type N-terminal cleavage/methylation domain-containing protein
VSTIQTLQTRRRQDGKSGFTLLELIVVLLVLGILAAIAVPTFAKVKENAVTRVVQSTLETLDRNGEAIAVSDYSLSDSQIATAVVAEMTPRAGMTVTRDGAEIVVEYTNASTTAEGSVTFASGIGTIVSADVSGGGGGGAPAFSLSYASSAFSLSSSLETKAPTVSGGTASSFSYTGTLPDGVSFDTTTGVFTGPSAWNFEVAQISSVNAHTCAVTTTGAAKCWGANFEGRLGDGTTTNSLTPVDVVGLGSGVASIAAGGSHTCAVTTSGAVKCWGFNSDGALGDGTIINRTTPVDVSGLGSGVASISAGSSHTCAVLTSGAAKCWGSNFSGRLGDGSTTTRFAPVDVSGLGSGVASISAGSYHTCAVLTSGAAKCWGDNGSGRLGDGSTTSSSTPVDVSGLGSGVASIAATSSHTCAVTTSGAAKCWGQNLEGRLGDGSATGRTTPVDVVGLGSGVARITGGVSHTCAVLTSGVAKCWGGNGNGQLGDGTTTNSLTPVDVSGLTSGAVSISSAGQNHTCVVMASGAAKCWGVNGLGRLGDGSTTHSSTPVTVVGFSGNPGWPVVVAVTVTSGALSDTQNITLTAS